ncbi:NAD(P)/FAD-dependent oxidoreductase [Chitinophaga horti]|uniref:NAD(P)/FAD-dependent oxidoreductase n=1 Tax=Chitinophaga horti TaxID=2920382 RepID=A0ABY6J9P1_9BACT|nr:NAD(P)/FAD-dependent oxidoreductase [Chitinophaga horti]UYQ95024.1 NAD(P)/FAD-dependent oxidoreductase [Chitinophaga horti]
MTQEHTEYDAIIVGAGPNGLSAAITMQRQGLRTLLLEAKETIGGGARSAELTLPGFVHDICSAVHPLAAGSPFFRQLDLEQFGLEYIRPPVLAAHPLDDGSAGALYRSFDETATGFGADEQAYRDLFADMNEYWPSIAGDVLGPLSIPRHPLQMAKFGLTALRSAANVVKRFKTPQARGWWAGVTGHSMLPLSAATTAAVGSVLAMAGHHYGWPVPKGGSQSIANALAACYTALGGVIETNVKVNSITQLPSSKTVFFDLSPKQVLSIAGPKLSALYQQQLKRYRYGMGVFKIDWALDGPVPFTSEVCRNAGTVHLGNTFEEISAAEQAVWNGHYTEKPFVLLAQQSLFDTGRVPAGKQAVWAYCHVPNGSARNMTTEIEAQVERFAPGFRDRILRRHTMNAPQMEAYNANYIGGDINGGVLDITQLFTRPALRLSPYRTSAKGLYICSASTPPGGGVHGLCGYHAAKRALKDIFNTVL